MTTISWFSQSVDFELKITKKRQLKILGICLVRQFCWQKEKYQEIWKKYQKIRRIKYIQKICICQPSQTFLEWLTLLLDGKDYVLFSRVFHRGIFRQAFIWCRLLNFIQCQARLTQILSMVLNIIFNNTTRYHNHG